jgi:hypothetical protein
MVALSLLPGRKRVGREIRFGQDQLRGRGDRRRREIRRARLGQATTIYGLTSTNSLVRFDSTAPGTVAHIGTISQPGIVDIDFYPGNAQLYAITGTGDTYTLRACY